MTVVKMFVAYSEREILSGEEIDYDDGATLGTDGKLLP